MKFKDDDKTFSVEPRSMQKASTPATYCVALVLDTTMKPLCFYHHYGQA